MGFLDSLKNLLSSEASQASAAKRDLEQRWNADLDRKEAELNATPAEKMEMLQDKIQSNDEAFDSIRSKVEHRETLADASSDVDEISESAATDADETAVEDVPHEAEIEDAVIVDPDENG